MATLQELKQKITDPRLQSLIGKSILVGLWQYYQDELVQQSQDFGNMIGFDDGIVLQVSDGKRLFIPVTYEAIIPAPRGKYKLKTTNQEVVNPDYLLSWRIDIEDDIEASQWEANTAPHHYSIVGDEWDYEYFHDSEYLKRLIETRGTDLIGKTLLIGIRHYKIVEGQRRFHSQTQKYGEITRLSYAEGIAVRLRDGTEYKLPPDISMIQPAPKMEYELQSTGEIIVNPDYMTQWNSTSE